VTYAPSVATGVPNAGIQGPGGRATGGDGAASWPEGPGILSDPVLGDVILEDRELRRAMAKASLRKNWRLAEASGVHLSEEEIDQEINQVRVARQRSKTR
jgi:hypothetical protein